MKKFVKQIPNIITCIRIAGAAAIIHLKAMSLPFLIVYGVCGITDVLDGAIARLTHSESKFGSRLDSVADLFFLGAMAYKIVPLCLTLLPAPCWIVMGTNTAIHIVAYIVCAFKFKKMSALHTYANKVMSALIFLFPFTLIGEIELLYTLYIYIGGVFAFYSALETLLIHCLAKRYDPRNKSIFLLKRNEANPIEEQTQEH